jgi:hypothetical protein
VTSDVIDVFDWDGHKIDETVLLLDSFDCDGINNDWVLLFLHDRGGVFLVIGVVYEAPFDGNTFLGGDGIVALFIEVLLMMI